MFMHQLAEDNYYRENNLQYVGDSDIPHLESTRCKEQYDYYVEMSGGPYTSGLLSKAAWYQHIYGSKLKLQEGVPGIESPEFKGYYMEHFQELKDLGVKKAYRNVYCPVMRNLLAESQELVSQVKRQEKENPFVRAYNKRLESDFPNNQTVSEDHVKHWQSKGEDLQHELIATHNKLMMAMGFIAKLQQEVVAQGGTLPVLPEDLL